MSIPFQSVPSLKIGQIVEVSGTRIKVELLGDVTELTRSHDGRVYPIGQIGSLVKIHFGRRLIFGFVTLLRMRSEEMVTTTPVPPDADQRVMEIDLFAEGSWNEETQKLTFRRGVTTYPLPRQGVHLLTRDEANALYRSAEAERPDGADPLVPFARYVGADAAECRANIDKMFALHCAVLGSTGSGKSGAVAALLHSVLDHKPRKGADQSARPRIVIIDPHGEYGAAFGDRAIVYRAYDPIGHDESKGQPIALPYWLMSAEEFRQLVIGKTEHEATSQHNVVYKALTHARMVAANLIEKAPEKHGVPVPKDDLELDDPRQLPGIARERVIRFDRDKPRPFSLDEFEHHVAYSQAARKKGGVTEPVPPSEYSKALGPILDKLAVLRRDPRLHFLMQSWSGDGPTLPEIIAQFVGRIPGRENKDIRIIDVSGLPNEVAGPLSAMLARILFQYKLYQTQAERERDPILLVCEEAHRYVPDRGEAEYAVAQAAIRRIAREGRKYGLGLMLVSQRPSDVESTVISQCGTWLVLRLTNAADQAHVAKFLPDGLAGLTNTLAALAQQEALFVGEGAALPARIRIRDLQKHQLPRSTSVSFAEGWAGERLNLDEITSVTKRMDESGPT